MRKLIQTVLMILLTAAPALGVSNDLMQKAVAGNAKAQYDMAYALMTGDGIETDYGAAMDWARKAAAAGNINANGLMGYMYYMGLGVEPDYAEAFKQYTLAAAAGDPDMLMRLGFCYLRGHGTAPDADKGREVMERAAVQGDAYAMFTLGMLHFQGEGLEHDQARAIYWFEKSVSARHPDGAIVLCRIYLAEDRPVAGWMWYNILKELAPQRLGSLPEAMDAVREDMTPAELDEGLAMAKTWLAEYALAQKTQAPVTKGNE